MNFRHARRVAPAALAAAALTGGLVLAGPANAAAPPFEPDSSAVGTLTFYNAAGDVITSGSTSKAPFAAYAVGSVSPRSTDKQAQLLFANPSSTAIPAAWYREGVGNYTQYPLTTGPSVIQTASQSMPVVAGTTDDQTLDGFESDSQISTVDGYKNVVQVRLKTANSANQSTSTYDDADLMIDPTTHTWTQIYPVVSGPASTTTTLTATPNPATVGGTVTLSATESPAAAGSIQFEDGTTPIGSPVAVDSAGKASTTTSTLTQGTHSLTAVFTPTDTTAYTGSTSTAVSETVDPVATTPDTSALAISASRTVNYGASVAIAANLKDTTTSTAIAGAKLTLQVRTSTTGAFRSAGTATTSATGTASVTVKPAANSQYEWVYAGDSTHKAVTSAIDKITVAQVVTGAVNHTSIKAGQTVDFYGAVSPVKTGTKVTLQQLVGKVWKNTKVVATVKKQKLPNGKTGYGYVLAVKISTRGTFTYRASVAATSTLAAGVSPAHNVKVA